MAHLIDTDSGPGLCGPHSVICQRAVVTSQTSSLQLSCGKCFPSHTQRWRDYCHGITVANQARDGTLYSHANYKHKWGSCQRAPKSPAVSGNRASHYLAAVTNVNPCCVLTRSAVLQGHQGYKVLAVIAENDGVSVALLGWPVERQVNPAHLQGSEIGTRFQTSQHFVCLGKEQANSLQLLLLVTLVAWDRLSFSEELTEADQLSNTNKQPAALTWDDNDWSSEDVAKDKYVYFFQWVILKSTSGHGCVCGCHFD